MANYHITAINNTDGEIYAFQIRKEAKGFFLYDLSASASTPINYYPNTKKALLRSIEDNYLIMKVETF